MKHRIFIDNPKKSYLILLMLFISVESGYAEEIDEKFLPYLFAESDFSGYDYALTGQGDRVIEIAEGVTGPQGPAGPQGEQGPAGTQGPPGNSASDVIIADLEARIAELENRPPPIFVTRTVWTETPIAAEGQGSATPAVCNSDEILIHGGWTSSDGVPAPKNFQFLTPENSGASAHTQKGFFENPLPVNTNVRIHALCGKLVQP